MFYIHASMLQRFENSSYVLYGTKRPATRKISPWGEIRPGVNSTLSVKKPL